MGSERDHGGSGKTVIAVSDSSYVSLEKQVDPYLVQFEENDPQNPQVRMSFCILISFACMFSTFCRIGHD